MGTARSDSGLRASVINSAHLPSPFFNAVPPALFWSLFIRRADSDRLTLLCIAACSLTSCCCLRVYPVIYTDCQQSPTTSSSLKRSKITPRHWASCSSVCGSQPLHVGGSHPDIPADVLKKGGALLMGTMHQLIVFFCGLVCHSSSALVVIFLLEFTLEERRLF